MAANTSNPYGLTMAGIGAMASMRMEGRRARFLAYTGPSQCPYDRAGHSPKASFVTPPSSDRQRWKAGGPLSDAVQARYAGMPACAYRRYVRPAATSDSMLGARSRDFEMNSMI